MENRYLRIAYAIQFILTLIAIFEIWPQVGGQGHLDSMSWYAKLLLPSALAFTTAKATASTVRRDRVWNAPTVRWLAAALALLVTMGILTFYEHLHEPSDDDEPAHVELSGA